eukprot:TRINITY_DN55180_c0_g1_i1.p2 TRINITY_DN55180_c0_g1~~TRINITY_DN55180_c0_g1_i1.p2  ORF type:complete len:126 (+),score=22.92 TRINITY_DN55180_c0_g1_i1:154-531(+)
MKRDATRRIAFCPLQTPLARELLQEHSRVQSLTTVVLIDEKGAHEKSTAIFRLMPYMGLPYRLLSPMLLCIPSFLCNPIYDLVYRNLGTISKHWPFDHEIEKYRDRMLGLEGKTLEEASSQFGSS